MDDKNRNFEDLFKSDYKGKSELAYEKIRDAIVNGVLKPGDKLETNQLAAALKVSRMPVREAIKRLQIEGLVDVKPHKEVTVTSVTVEQMKDVFLVRAVLEGLASREAALRIKDEELNKLWGLYEEMKQAVEGYDTAGQLVKNREFHQLIHEISGNKLLLSIADKLLESVQRFRKLVVSTPMMPEEILEDHRQIIEAIGSHSPKKAEKLMRSHIERATQLILGR